ncbi:methionine ABC transporter ATP-binding protein [Micromonospora echinospora]|uniref:Peptide/nickel transport system ATP-binding protein n=1 Tax=Micromonospora echinospora TaxID=1877 RepID=A0A1C4UVI4_MICEC|nr:ABC transporter ATP-binding protein [Micromonospora echinospora]OZV75189.1 methionine ABC transporter ATP-binding protein [Micromonospora echinospora]SCE75737.1 peptide/nickel transport system ATP-binding protein [Micromonospora echinospora]
MTSLLEVADLRVEFPGPTGPVRAVNGVSLEVESGRTLALLGESGSGKSVTAQAVMGILDTPPARVDGAVRLRGRELLTLPRKQRDRVSGEEIGMVFQDAMAALNPVFTVGDQIIEVLRVRRGMSKADARRRAVELVDRVHIPAAKDRIRDYPHQFSGGMRQRIMIALAISLEPDLLIADEPTTALDVTVQAQVMELLAEIQRDSGMGLLLITHDLGVVAEVADDVAVMYAGRIVERGSVGQIFAGPAHPYTEGLLASMPRVDRRDEVLYAIPGAPPNPARLPTGCPFHLRCPRVTDECRVTLPPLETLPAGRASACHHHEEVLGATR